MSFLKVIPSVAAPSSPVGDVLRGVGPKRAAIKDGVVPEDVELDEKEAAALEWCKDPIESVCLR